MISLSTIQCLDFLTGDILLLKKSRAIGLNKSGSQKIDGLWREQAPPRVTETRMWPFLPE
jgi:hypothetical protein